MMRPTPSDILLAQDPGMAPYPASGVWVPATHTALPPHHTATFYYHLTTCLVLSNTCCPLWVWNSLFRADLSTWFAWVGSNTDRIRLPPRRWAVKVAFVDQWWREIGVRSDCAQGKCYWATRQLGPVLRTKRNQDKPWGDQARSQMQSRRGWPQQA